jgi:hypothetical protein
MYSHGVHSYFTGNLNRADIYLYRAIELNPNDPRPYYFRGLALMRLGRTWEAQDVIEQGAAVEASARSSSYSIGEALERVQGADRLRLEELRRTAKLNQNNSATERARRRSDARERVQINAQRRRLRLPLETFSHPIQPDQFSGLVVPDEPLPQAPAVPPDVEAPVATPPQVVAADEGDPFADDPSPAAADATAPSAAELATPSPAAGTVKAGRLPGIFGRILGRQLPSVDVGRLRGMVPGAGGGGAPPIMPEGFDGAVPQEFGAEPPPGADAEVQPGFDGLVPPGADPFADQMPPDAVQPQSEVPPSDETENPF